MSLHLPSDEDCGPAPEATDPRCWVSRASSLWSLLLPGTGGLCSMSRQGTLEAQARVSGLPRPTR